MATSASVDELGPGDHACLTFSDQEERLDIVAAFVRVGLGQGHKVVCFTESYQPEALSAELVDRGVPLAELEREGQFALQTSDESWLVDGAFSAEQMLDLLTRQINLAKTEGYAGLRITADMAWATRPVIGVEQLVVFETAVTRLFTDGQVTAICQYDRMRFDAVTLASAAEIHACAVAATVYYEDPVLRVCRQHSPPGVRVAGEIDYTRVDALNRALAEAVRLDNDVHVNLAQLRFMDAAAAGALVQAALSLAPQRRMTVVCGRLVWRLLQVLGAGDVPQLRVVMINDDP